MLRHAGLDDESVERMGLAIREAVANGVLHGNKADPDKRVAVSFHLNQREISIEVRDEGEGFDLDSLPDPLSPDNLYKPRGRGILLMRTFMDDLDFEFNRESGTVVTLRKRIVPADADKEEAR